LKQLKTGKLLWETIEEAARKKHAVGNDYVLKMVDLDISNKQKVGKCKYRISSTKEQAEITGTVSYEPYIKMDEQ
jgi:hypothetical protein